MSVQPFPPGTKVCDKKTKTRTGIVLDRPVKIIGPTIRQSVLFEGEGEKQVPVNMLEKVEEVELSLMERLEKGGYGTVQDLRNAITLRRLSGVLENMIYSMQITNTDFYPFQFIPLLRFLQSDRNCLLIADEVGLGKTIEAGLIWTELRMRSQAQRLLVIVPASLREKWRKELSDRFGIDATVYRSADELLTLMESLEGNAGKGCSAIVSMQTLRGDRGRSGPLSTWMDEKPGGGKIFDLIVVDEAHHMRNKETQTNKAVRELRRFARGILFLSATPIQTKNENLFQLLNILDEESFPFPDSVDYIIEMNKPLVGLIGALQRGSVGAIRTEQSAAPDLERLTAREVSAAVDCIIEARDCWGFDNTVLKGIQKELAERKIDVTAPRDRVQLVRRLDRLNPLSQVMTRTLKRFVHEKRVQRQAFAVAVTPTKAERAYYDLVINKIREYYARDGRQTGNPSGLVATVGECLMESCMAASVQSWISALPYREDGITEEALSEDAEIADSDLTVFQKVLGPAVGSFEFLQDLRAHDSKWEKLKETVEGYFAENPGKKIILFSFFKKTLSYLKGKFDEAGIRSVTVTGDVDPETRNELMKEFKEGDVPVLLSSEVAAEGIDLQFVSCMINYDLPWNPARIEQRIGRIDRLKQESPVITIFNFFHRGTIGQRIYDQLLTRLDVFNSALGISEIVLGDVIRKLSAELFREKLTPEQEERIIRDKATALENQKAMAQDAEGFSLVYKEMSEQIRQSKEMERYVVDSDLLNFVLAFCDREPGGSRLVESVPGSGLYHFSLSAAARGEFERFWARHWTSGARTMLLQDENLLLRFKNKEGWESAGVERVTQNHPLIAFVADWFARHDLIPHDTAAVLYEKKPWDSKALSDIPAGSYAYRIESWNFSRAGGDRDRIYLSYTAVAVETGAVLSEELAEVLVNSVARTGRTDRSPRAVDDSVINAHCLAEDDLRERFGVKYEELSEQARIDADTRNGQYQQKLKDLAVQNEARKAALRQACDEKTGEIADEFTAVWVGLPIYEQNVLKPVLGKMRDRNQTLTDSDTAVLNRLDERVAESVRKLIKARAANINRFKGLVAGADQSYEKERREVAAAQMKAEGEGRKIEAKTNEVSAGVIRLVSAAQQ